MIIVESAGLTDVGRKRKLNEDSFFTDDNMHLYVVADGMGGHQAGEIASNLVVKTIKDYMTRFQNDEEVEELEDTDKTLSKEANRIISGIHLSNQVVYQASRNKSSYRGMGSTVSAVYFTEQTLIATNVGDSPIYLIRDGSVETLSVPHTVVAEQEALDPEGGKRLGKEFSHMLTRAMGVEKNVKPDICEIQMFENDVLVICSDGLSDKLSPEEIGRVAYKSKPEKSCRMLVDMALERGGDDNITVIVLLLKKMNHHGGGFTGWFSQLMKRFFTK